MWSPEVRNTLGCPSLTRTYLCEKFPYNILPSSGIKIGVGDTIDNSDFCEDYQFGMFVGSHLEQYFKCLRVGL
jgi:hypothetical protein